MSDAAPKTIVALLAEADAAGRWELDPGSSTIAFAVKHFWGLVTVRGTFARFTGHATVEPSGAIFAELVVDADSLDTKNKQRDGHLRADDFFDVAEHSTVMFTTTSVSLVGDDRFHVVGELVAAGRSQVIEFDAEVGDATAATAITDITVEIDRTTFGMVWSPLRMAAPIARVDLHVRWNKTAA